MSERGGAPGNSTASHRGPRERAALLHGPQAVDTGVSSCTQPSTRPAGLLAEMRYLEMCHLDTHHRCQLGHPRLQPCAQCRWAMSRVMVWLSHPAFLPPAPSRGSALADTFQAEQPGQERWGPPGLSGGPEEQSSGLSPHRPPSPPGPEVAASLLTPAGGSPNPAPVQTPGPLDLGSRNP